MGLRVIDFAPFKRGKTVFGLTLAEIGPLGAIDSERRMEHYTVPHPTIKAREFPYNFPRKLRTDNEMCARNAELKAAFERSGVVYVVPTKDLFEAGRAIAVWAKDPEIAGIDVDSASVLWDLLQDARDTSRDTGGGTFMLSWVPIKRFLKRFSYALDAGGKHVVMTAHQTEMMKLQGGELTVVGVKPALEKKMPHWADMTVTMLYPEEAAHPTLMVVGEGVGGAGGMVRGAKMENPTFRKLLEKVSPGETLAPISPEQNPEEVEYRNKTTLEKIAGSAPIKGVEE